MKHEEEYTKEELEKLQQIKKKGIGNSIRNVRMGDENEKKNNENNQM